MTILKDFIRFKWHGVFLPFFACGSKVILSLVLIIMPKVVLDAVEQGNHTQELLVKILVLSVTLSAVSILDMRLHNSILLCSQEFLYKRLTVLWTQKAVSVDYNVLITNKGKLLLERARQAIASPNQGVVNYLEKCTLVLEAFVGLIVYCGIVGSLHIWIVLILMVFFGIELLAGIKIEEKKQQLKDERAAATRKINYMAYGTRGLQAGKDIRIFSMTRLLREISQGVIAEKREVEARAENWRVYRLAVTALLILLRDGFAYVYLCYMFLNGNMTIGDFSFYFAAIAGVGGWLTKLSQAISGYIEARNYVKDFNDFLALPDGISGEEKDLDIQVPIEIVFDHVSFSYHTIVDGEDKEVSIFKDLNVTIHKGEKVAVVGINGAGKSTFIKLLCGMLRPEAGKIYINGIDSSILSREAYYRLFSVVFQSSRLLPISIADNIMLNIGEYKNTTKMWNCIRMAGLEEKINTLPQKENTCLVKGVSEGGVSLSGGQEQRLFLARALYKDAPFLILDEPTAALDPLAERDIYEKYAAFTEGGKTSVFVSHRLASTRFCDRILLMEDGKIIESGTHEELIKLGGRYREMFEIQSKYYKEEKETV